MTKNMIKKIITLTLISFLGFSCSSNKKKEEPTAEKNYLEAHKILKRKNYSEAADLFDKIDDDFPFSKWGPKAKTMAVYSGFTEGVQLFSSFAILLNFPRHNLMKGMGQIVTWSIRDETLHVENVSKLFRTFIAENPEIWTDKLKYEIYCAAERVVELEDKFIDICFDKADIPDLTAKEVKEYIRYIADRRLLGLGMKAIFHSVENPLPWIDMQVNAVEHTNFFENRATEYAKASTQGNWQDIFK